MGELQRSPICESFCDGYAAARALFRERARRIGAELQTHVHPRVRGPAGEDLAVDVAVLGAKHAYAALLLISGTHGVEGYAGSGIQCATLSSGLIRELTQCVRVVLIHAINPYGFAYGRRTNENNVDLNRNFADFRVAPPSNPAARSAAAPFMRAGDAPTSYPAIERRLARARAQDEYGSFLQALQPGQYEEPTGLFYGGSEPAWSNTVLRRICKEHLRGCTRIAAIDLHTGLGPRGVGELLFVGRTSAAQLERYGSYFSPPVSVAGKAESVSAEVHGSLLDALVEESPAVELIAAILEFGTLALPDVMDALVIENWAHHQLPGTHPVRRQSTQQLRAAFYCESDAQWMESLVARTSEVLQQAAARLIIPL